MSRVLDIDELDVRLLGLLADDARAGVVELARRLGVARNTVQARMQRLERTGVIRGYRAEVDLAAAGVEVQVDIALEVVQGEFPAVVEALAGIPEVLEAEVVTGQADLRVRVATVRQSLLQPVLARIWAIPGVGHSNTSLLLATAVPHRTQPLLDALTRDAGVGRATPAP